MSKPTTVGMAVRAQPDRPPARRGSAHRTRVTDDRAVIDETSLRIGRNIRGWADALTLGFDEQHLDGYKRTSEARTVGPIRFVGTPAPTLSAYGGARMRIASDFVLGDTTGTVVTVDSAVAGADEVLLAAAADPVPHLSRARCSGLAGKSLTFAPAPVQTRVRSLTTTSACKRRARGPRRRRSS